VLPIELGEFLLGEEYLFNEEETGEQQRTLHGEQQGEQHGE